jgi:opacity protein-like surface antigen
MVFNFGHQRAVPYISVGAGAARLTPHVPDTPANRETRFTTTVGAGVKVFFNRNVGMRFEGRYYGTSLPDSDRRSCDRHFDRCDNRGWLSNGDVTGGLIFAF